MPSLLGSLSIYDESDVRIQNCVCACTQSDVHEEQDLACAHIDVDSVRTQSDVYAEVDGQIGQRPIGSIRLAEVSTYDC